MSVSFARWPCIVVVSTQLIRWTQAASGAAGRVNVGFAGHLVSSIFVVESEAIIL